MDLLTVRYFQLIGRDTDRLYELNSGPEHSGLDSAELRNRTTLLDAYGKALKESVHLVFNTELRARSYVRTDSPSS